MSLQKIASAEASFVASVRTAVRAVNGVGAETDLALADLRAALAAANDRLRAAVAELSCIIGEADDFAAAAGAAASALAADVAAMITTPAAPENKAGDAETAPSTTSMITSPAALTEDANYCDRHYRDAVAAEEAAPVNRVAEALAAADMASGAKIADDACAKVAAAHGNGRPRGKRRKGQ